MTIYRLSGELMLGSRLRRLGEKLFFDISKVYKSEDIDFEPAWFPLFFLLKGNEKLSVSDIASSMEITHPGASQMITTLENKGLIECTKDANDKRIRMVTFTKKGSDLLEEIQPIWVSVKKCAQEMLSEGENSKFLLSTLSEIEDLLTMKSFFERVKEDIHTREVLDKLEFIPYEDSYKDTFKEIVLEWLIENSDRAIEDTDFFNKAEEGLGTGELNIIFIKSESGIIGMSIIKTLSDNNAEILVLYIKNKWRNMQIENRLLEYTIKKLQEMDIDNIYAKLDRRSINLIKVFRNINFTLSSLEKDNIGNNIKLVLKKERNTS
jgi:DNA-binding MarR family transcriptional regulator/ribosomal protein S18 acetylase RimI-like enzyme